MNDNNNNSNTKIVNILEYDQVQKISEAMKRKRITDKELSNNWLFENELGSINNRKQKKRKTKLIPIDFNNNTISNSSITNESNTQTQSPILSISKRKRGIIDNNFSDKKSNEADQLMDDLFSNRIKKPFLNASKLKPTTDELFVDTLKRHNELSNDLNHNQDVSVYINEYNEKSKEEFKKLPIEARVEPLSKWMCTYTLNINKASETIHNEVIENLSQIIDSKTDIENIPKKVIKKTDKTVFKKPSIKQKKDELRNSTKGISTINKTSDTNTEQNGNSQDKSSNNVSANKSKNASKKKIDATFANSREFEIMKNMFFEHDTDNLEFKKKIEDYSVLFELLADERLKETFKEKYRGLIFNNANLKPKELPICSFGYIANYLCESKGKEFGHRECISGTKCMGMILPLFWTENLENIKPRDSFILREFLFPEQEKHYIQTGILPEFQSYCFLCNCFITTYRYYFYKYISEEPIEILQNFEIKVDEKDGYNINYCLDPLVNIMTTKNNSSKPNKKQNFFTGIIAPFLKFSKENYTFKEHRIKFYKRNGDYEILLTKTYEQSPKLNFQLASTKN
jgi:hypothetical protein